MEWVRTAIIKGTIADNFWPKILLAMPHISNLLLTILLNELSLYEALTRLSPQLNYFRVLKFIVYIFIYKEKRKIKSAKW